MAIDQVSRRAAYRQSTCPCRARSFFSERAGHASAARGGANPARSPRRLSHRDVRTELAVRRSGASTPSLASQLVAAVPAVIAGVQAFRAGMGSEPHSDNQSSNHHHKENAS
jgi:hypothetical protein